MSPPIPLPILRNLVCRHCHRFITCGPVHVAPDSSVLCGRCQHYARPYYRNGAFEALASLFYYPCHYWHRHCDRKLRWDESLEHERDCPADGCCSVFCGKAFCRSDRKLPSTGGGTPAHDVPREVLETLKCVACEGFLSSGPVYILEGGGNICHRCVHSNGFPKGAVPNLAFEVIAQAALFPCQYVYRGCTARLPFGREVSVHEHQCHWGRIQPAKKQPSMKAKGKERGVIETHSGHVWGTITPNSALFAPPRAKKDGQMIQQEFAQVAIRKKNKDDETKSFDSQSMDSVVSSVGDVPRSTGDNISRSTVDNISRDNVSGVSSRPSTRDGDYYADDLRCRREAPIYQSPRYYQGEYRGGNLHHTPSFNQPRVSPTHRVVQRSESLRMGNSALIEELKERNRKRMKKEDNPYGQCNNLQDVVQLHRDVFVD